jgi:hypothetical protein
MCSILYTKMYWYIYDSYFYVFFHNDVIKWKKKNKNVKDRRPIVAQLAQQFLAIHSWSIALISLPLYIICSMPQTLTLASPLIHSPQATTPGSMHARLLSPPSPASIVSSATAGARPRRACWKPRGPASSAPPLLVRARASMLPAAPLPSQGWVGESSPYHRTSIRAATEAVCVLMMLVGCGYVAGRAAASRCTACRTRSSGCWAAASYEDALPGRGPDGDQDRHPGPAWGRPRWGSCCDWLLLMSLNCVTMC